MSSRSSAFRIEPTLRVIRMSGRSFLRAIASAERLKRNITSTPAPDRLGLETTIPAAETNSGGSCVPANRCSPSLDKLTASHLSTLITEVLTNSIYRDNARKLQKAIAEANGLSVAADRIEQALGIGQNAGTNDADA